MIQIKKTQSVEMMGDGNEVIMMIKGGLAISIPIKSVFQVKRGLESYIQKFYRKHEKHTK